MLQEHCTGGGYRWGAGIGADLASVGARGRLRPSRFAAGSGGTVDLRLDLTQTAAAASKRLAMNLCRWPFGTLSRYLVNGSAGRVTVIPLERSDAVI